MAQSSVLNDLQFWQATTGESLHSVANNFRWTSSSDPSRRFPWALLGIVGLLYYFTSWVSWQFLLQLWHQGPFFNGSLIGGSGIAALGYFCWRLTEDMGQRWQERHWRSGCEIHFSQPVFRFDQPMALCFRHFLKPGQPMPEGSTVRAQIYCETSTNGAGTGADNQAANPGISWQVDLGEVAIAPQAQSQLVPEAAALEAHFNCTIPSGLPIACSIDIPTGDREQYQRMEVKWWLRFDVVLPGLATYNKALPIAIRPDAILTHC